MELPESLAFLADVTHALNGGLRKTVSSACDGLLLTLGIPGESAVEIVAPPGGGALAGGTTAATLRVHIGESRARYPDDLLRTVVAYVYERSPAPDMTPQGVVELLGQDAVSTSPATQRRVVECLARICLEIVKRHPAPLMGPEQGRAYLQLLPPLDAGKESSDEAADAAWLTDLLRHVLELRISIADMQTVANVLAEARRAARSAPDAAEELIEALRPDVVEIQAPREFLRELTTLWTEERQTLVPRMRDALSEELGLEFPPLRFVAAEDQKPRTFAFTINHLTTMPLAGLTPDQCLVRDTSERLRMWEPSAQPAVNVASGQPASVIPLAREPMVQAGGLTTWNQLQHVVLCLDDCLRQHAWCLIHRGGIDRQLQQVKREFPVLVNTARSTVADHKIVQVVRDLLRERVPVRNLRAVLEELLEIQAQDAERVAPRDRSGHDVVQRVRLRLGGQIAQQAGNYRGVVIVYLVDPAIARLTGASSEPTEAMCDSIVQSVRAELAYLPATASLPSLITFVESRFALQRIVRSEFPRLSIIAHEELPPGTTVMPVARIAMKTSAET